MLDREAFVSQAHFSGHHERDSERGTTAGFADCSWCSSCSATRCTALSREKSGATFSLGLRPGICSGGSVRLRQRSDQYLCGVEASPKTGLRRKSWRPAAASCWSLPSRCGSPFSTVNPVVESVVQLTNDRKAKTGTIVTDGARIYFTVGPTGSLRIAQVSVSGGQIGTMSMQPRENPQIVGLTAGSDLHPGRSQCARAHAGEPCGRFLFPPGKHGASVMLRVGRCLPFPRRASSLHARE